MIFELIWYSEKITIGFLKRVLGVEYHHWKELQDMQTSHATKLNLGTRLGSIDFEYRKKMCHVCQPI